MTPSTQPEVTSASTSKLRKRNSATYSVHSMTAPRGGNKLWETTHASRSDKENHDLMSKGPSLHLRPSLHLQKSEQSLGRRSAIFQPSQPGGENAQSSWLHRKSTLSSLKSGSPATTERPVSAAVSYSNGSTAPILPDLSNLSPSPAPRNKLVKRSSSHRALQGSNGMHSAFRRPATSHQRSATLQRQLLEEEESAQRPNGSPKFSGHDDTDRYGSYDDSMQIWRPFFKPRSSRMGKVGSSGRRNARGGFGKEDPVRNIVPDITELPTLVLATSISTRSSEEGPRRYSSISALSRPFTPLEYHPVETPDAHRRGTPAKTESEPKPRNSFSLSEMFPSPSPLTWKMPRTGSLRNKKSFNRSAGGRRITSAPQSAQTRRRTGSSHGASRPRIATLASPQAEPLTGLDNRAVPNERFQMPPSSPLPPLNRLSVFEIDLPTTLPSYPTSSPTADHATPFRNFSSRSSPSLSSQMRRSMLRDQSHRPSGAPSDLNSTVLGSENDHSRLFSGDEEDADGRSDTIYDSTRTGATGNSVSALKRPHIDTIFDESPSVEDAWRRTNVRRDASETLSRTAEKQPVEATSSPNSLTFVNEASKGANSPHSLHVSAKADSTTKSPSAFRSEIASQTSPQQSPNVQGDEDLWALGISSEVQNQSRSTHDGEPPTKIRNNPPRSWKSTPRRRHSPPGSGHERSSKANIFEWSEQPEKEQSPSGSPRPKTVDGRQVQDARGGRINGRRGPSALHLRSQSVPVPDDYRNHGGTSKLDSWTLGNKGPSEDWDGDFEFEEPMHAAKQTPANAEVGPSGSLSGMLVPSAILERQASVHGQFGQVKELTLLVEELKRLQQRASGLGILHGQASELWKEAEGIIELATIDDDEQDLLPPRSPQSSATFDFEFDEDSPLSRSRGRSGFSPPRDDNSNVGDDFVSQASSQRSHDTAKGETTPASSRPRKESSAMAKSVLETIHHQRSQHDPSLLDARLSQSKLPFDTTSLKDLVTRAGVVTRALKEIVRRAEGGSPTPEPAPTTPKDPPLSQIFQQPSLSSPVNKSPQVTQSPKTPRSPKSPKSSTFMGGSISGNDNEINGHMKMMTVV